MTGQTQRQGHSWAHLTLLENQSKNDHTGSRFKREHNGILYTRLDKAKVVAFWFQLRWCLASVVRPLCTSISVVQEKEKRPCACCTARLLYTSIWCTTNPLSNLSIWSRRGKEAVARVPLERRKKRRSNCVFFFSPNSKTLLWGLWPRLAPVRSGAASTPGFGQRSGGFWCRYLVRFRRVPVKIPVEAPEGSVQFRRFRCRYLVRFRKVPVQIPCEVPEGSGADALWNSKGLRCFFMA